MVGARGFDCSVRAYDYKMTPQNWLTLAAIVAGPMSVFWLQRWREKVRDKRGRRLHVFRELMLTRGTRLSQRHVEALNAIDVEYYGDDKISEAWKIYFDHFCQANPQQRRSEAELAVWSQKGDDLLNDLLYAMAQALGYRFDEVAIKRNVYTPIAHGQLEDDLNAIRKGFVEVLSGTKRIPMDVDFANDLKDSLANAAKQAEAAKNQKPQITGE
jgi:hypothetical protein